MSSYTMNRKYGIFNATIIPLALVRYELVIANSYLTPAHETIVEYTHTPWAHSVFYATSAGQEIFVIISPALDTVDTFPSELGERIAGWKSCQ